MGGRERARVSCTAFAALGAILLGSSASPAQSLGEAARKEKERRVKAPSGGPTKSYSTEDLTSFHVDGPAPEATPPPPDKKSRAPVAGDERPRAGQETYWRGRAAQARWAVDQAERRVADLERRAAATMIAPPDGIVVRRERWSQTREGILTALAEARAELTKARKAVESLEDEGRRAGALPGWLR